jgi:hypothetical protein
MMWLYSGDIAGFLCVGSNGLEVWVPGGRVVLWEKTGQEQMTHDNAATPAMPFNRSSASPIVV